MAAILQPFGKSIWIADGPIVRAFGFAFPTRMIVIKLANGDLWINSPVQWAFEEMQKVAAIGPVRHLVSPTPLHDWRLEAWAEAFPGARSWPAKSLDEAPSPEWIGDLDQVVFRGSRVLSEVEFFHRSSRTLIMGDFIQNYPPSGNAIRNLFVKWAGVNGGTPIDARASFIGKKAEGRASINRILSWKFDKLVIAHGECVDQDAREFVLHAFSWLSAGRFPERLSRD